MTFSQLIPESENMHIRKGETIIPSLHHSALFTHETLYQLILTNLPPSLFYKNEHTHKKRNHDFLLLIMNVKYFILKPLSKLPTKDGPVGKGV